MGSQLTAVAMPLEISGLVPMVVTALWGGAIAGAVDRRQMLLAGNHRRSFK